jgi:ribonucleoside-triphosphate reductase
LLILLLVFILDGAPLLHRTVRNDAKDPITQFLIDAGVPHEPDQRNPSAFVFVSPKITRIGVVRTDVGAIDFLDIWKTFQENWCEHKPSVTISVSEDEWLPVAAWVYDNFDIVSGVSFLPFDPTEYPQAPYQTMTEEEYNEWIKKMPETIDWSRLSDYEKEDNTGAVVLAGVGGTMYYQSSQIHKYHVMSDDASLLVIDEENQTY